MSSWPWQPRRNVRFVGKGVPVTDDEKDAAHVKFFPPAIPLAVILLAIALNALLPIELAVRLPAPIRYWVGGAIAVGAIVCLGAWSVLIMRRSGQSENPWKPTTSIIERGPFRITRNPMYLQMVLVCIGVAVALMNIWLFLLTPLCAWLLQRTAIIPEERYLEVKFGDAYLDYKSRVPRWL
jgi:protein-S-isoprenylcysteine O-methyltransferase Ste14